MKPIFKPEIIRLFTPTEETPPKGILDVFDEFIQSHRTHCTKATVQKYTTVRKHLHTFQETTGYNLTFETIPLEFQDVFRV